MSWLSIRNLLSAPSRRALRQANDKLHQEIDAHRQTLQELEAAKAQLARQVQDQVEDLRVLTERFETALGGSAITISEQDENLRYTWVYNPPMGMLASHFVGHTERELMDPAAAEHIQAAKRAALQTGQPQRGEADIAMGSGHVWLSYTVTPTRLRDGSRGVLTSSTNVTLLKEQQAHLELLMQELNHRSKNLLTIVQSIARQSATGLEVPKEFLERLSARLRALAHAHDALVQHNWRCADLRSVIEGQLRHQLDGAADRIQLKGEPLELPPEVAHYVGLALHELGANALKYGALSEPSGRVEVDWAVQTETPRGPRLMLQWREIDGPKVTPAARRGFGRTLLETLTPKAMSGDSELDFGEDGVRWTLEAPLPRAAQAAEANRA